MGWLAAYINARRSAIMEAMDYITIRVHFSDALRDPQGVAEALAQEIADAAKRGEVKWRATTAGGGTAVIERVEAR